jgi:hypothetical protein
MAVSEVGSIKNRNQLELLIGGCEGGGNFKFFQIQTKEKRDNQQ